MSKILCLVFTLLNIDNELIMFHPDELGYITPPGFSALNLFYS